MTILLGVVAALALLEWARLGGLPPRHVIAIEVANAAVMAAIATRGTAAADILVGGLAFAAALLPVARPDTSRAFRDFGDEVHLWFEQRVSWRGARWTK